jgi:outer membrane lipoprotein-sorting protein
MRRLALSVLILAFTGPAWADSKATLHEAFSKFLAAKSFRATITDAKSGEQLSAMEFVAPNRYHMRNKGMETIIVGDDAWMNMNGQMMKVPVPVGKMIAQFRSESMQRQIESGIVITDLGSDSVGGEPAHAYSYTVTEPAKTDVKLWISDHTGLPLQLESQGSFMGKATTTRVHYSDYNDAAINIAAP